MLLAAAAMLFVAVDLSAADPGRPENVLLILADDVGVTGVRCYGASPHAPRTPNLDRLARQGVLFRNAWSNPSCSPARAGIFTGKHAFRTGVGTVILPSSRNVLDLRQPLLPRLASSAGYATALFGKWHLGNKNNGGDRAPNLAGWSHFAGASGVTFRRPYDYFQWPRTVDGQTGICHRYATSQTVDDALAWIAEQEGPWFCCVSFNAAHAPFHVPPPPLQHTGGKEIAGDARLCYRAMIEAMDTEIGRLLRDMGPELARTNVIFAGDNGTPREVVQPPHEPLHGKGSVYQGGVNVPLLIGGPSVQAPGREVQGVAHTLDLFATVLDLIGADLAQLAPTAGVDSLSLAPYLVDPEQPPLRATVYTEGFLGATPRVGFAAIRDARFKLIRKSGLVTRYELYDLARDPLERRNLLLHRRRISSHASEAYRTLRREMEALKSR